MTLLDLFRLIGRYWKLCVALPVLCVLVCAGYLFVSHSDDTTYTAQSRIVVSTHVQEVGGLAQAQGRAHTSEDESIKVTAGADANTKTVTITVVTTDRDLSLELANDIADTVLEEAFDFVPEIIDDPFNARIEKAEAAKESASSNDGRMILLAAVLAGLILAVCLIVAIDAVRRPVKGSSDLAEASGLPVLGEVPSDTGERLLANARFAAGKKSPHKVLIIPVSEVDSAVPVGLLVDGAVCEESPSESEAHGGQVQVSTCAPLSQGVSAAYEARSADAVLVTCAQWEDSLKSVESTVEELRLAGANIVGCVLVKAARGSHKRGGSAQ